MHVSRLTNQLVSGQARHYGYTFRSQMNILDDMDGNVFSYAFDGDPATGLGAGGNRISQGLNDCLSARFVYDGENVLLDLSEDYGVVHAYVHGPGIDNIIERIGFINDEIRQRHVYHADGLGSIVAITDGNQNEIRTYAYDAFGGIRSEDGDPVINRHTYTSREALGDRSGVYYYRDRLVDPAIGRFLSVDPLGFGDGPNCYAYVNNNPINYVDPMGEQYWGLHEGCCGGQRFNDKEECCENDAVVGKETVWICRRPLRALGGLPQVGPISHSFVQCDDPATNPGSRSRFGMQPRHGGEGGIRGPGYIVREPQDFDTDPANCRERQVCPKDKERMCKEGKTRDRYFMFSPNRNCHGLAAGRCR